MPPRHLRRRERDRVAHQPHRRPRREHELLLRLVLLQDVVLQRAAERAPGDARLLGLRDVHGEDHRRRRVDRHRRRDRTQIDAAVQVLHVGQACRPRHRTGRPRRPTADHRNRDPSASACRTPSTTRRHPPAKISLNRQFVSSAVPNPANIRIVHSFDRYIEAYGPRVYGYCPGNSPSSGPYTGAKRHPRHRLEVGIPMRRPHRTPPATHHVDGGSPAQCTDGMGTSVCADAPVLSADGPHAEPRRLRVRRAGLARADSYPIRTSVSTCR